MEQLIPSVAEFKQVRIPDNALSCRDYRKRFLSIPPEDKIRTVSDKEPVLRFPYDMSHEELYQRAAWEIKHPEAMKLVSTDEITPTPEFRNWLFVLNQLKTIQTFIQHLKTSVTLPDEPVYVKWSLEKCRPGVLELFTPPPRVKEYRSLPADRSQAVSILTGLFRSQILLEEEEQKILGFFQQDSHPTWFIQGQIAQLLEPLFRSEAFLGMYVTQARRYFRVPAIDEKLGLNPEDPVDTGEIPPLRLDYTQTIRRLPILTKVEAILKQRDQPAIDEYNQKLRARFEAAQSRYEIYKLSSIKVRDALLRITSSCGNLLATSEMKQALKKTIPRFVKVERTVSGTELTYWVRMLIVKPLASVVETKFYMEDRLTFNEFLYMYVTQLLNQ